MLLFALRHLLQIVGRKFCQGRRISLHIVPWTHMVALNAQKVLLKAPVGAMPLRGYLVTTTLLDGHLLRAVLLRRLVLHALHRLGLRGCVWRPRGGNLKRSCDFPSPPPFRPTLRSAAAMAAAAHPTVADEPQAGSHQRQAEEHRRQAEV